MHNSNTFIAAQSDRLLQICLLGSLAFKPKVGGPEGQEGMREEGVSPILRGVGEEVTVCRMLLKAEMLIRWRRWTDFPKRDSERKGEQVRGSCELLPEA